MIKKICPIIKTKKIAILSLLTVLVLSMFVLYTPKPQGSNIEDSFSAVRASEHIAVIAREPHSYFDRDALSDVRDYVANITSDYLGAGNVTRMPYSNEEMKVSLGDKVSDDHIYGIENILATIPGSNPSGVGIMLVAHFDSRGHVGRAGELGESYGAMDDGYGVSSMLELAYLLKDSNPVNSIHFLFTDAEEVGLYGARMAALDSSIMGKTNFVINLESRGAYGPTYMFETSNNNKKVIDLYKKARLPITYSMATAVYSVMPNFTDFTPFIDEGVAGLNFATLAGLDYYHSPLDRYENIDQSSIQHMGVQVEPIVREYMNDVKYSEDNYFEANQNQVFFTLLPNVLVAYSETMAMIFSLMLLIVFILLVFYLVKTKKVNKNILKHELPKVMLFSLLVIIIGYIFSNIIAFLGKTNFNIVYTRVSGANVPTLIFMILITLVLIKKIAKANINNILLLGIGINLLLAVVTTFTLSGASFLFFVTALFGTLSLFVSNYKNKYLKHSVYVVSYAIMLFMIIPLLYSFYMALTVGGVAILVVLMLINGAVSVPLILKQFSLY